MHVHEQVPTMLKEAGVSRITFVGGEPFLHPLLPALIKEAKAQGLVTMAITNGSRLSPELLLELKGHLDWIGFSVDASNGAMHAELGRGLSSEVTGECVFGDSRVRHACMWNNTMIVGTVCCM